jgi:glycosyltransferase involved in cell wall biosynthesis
MKKINKKIKLFIYIDSFRIGGMHRQILFLVKHINKELFEPIVCVSIDEGGLMVDFKNSGSKLISLGWRGRFDLGMAIRLSKVLQNVQPDIVFITEAQNLVYFKLAKLFWWKSVVQIGSFRALTFWLGPDKKKFHFIDNLFSKWLYNSSDYITTNSNALNSHYSNIGNVKKNKPIQTIYNGSDFKFEITKFQDEIRKELGISANEVVIIMIARLDPWKDFTTLFEAARIAIDRELNIKFVVVGDGELREFLEQKILQLNLHNKVLLIGEKKDIYNYHNLADISILSTNGEGFSNSILEAMAFGKPVIVTDVGGNSELIGESGKSGVLVPSKSPEILADEIVKLAINKNIRDEMGKSAKVRIHQLCDVTNYVNSYESLFIEAMNYSEPKSLLHKTFDSK